MGNIGRKLARRALAYDMKVRSALRCSSFNALRRCLGRLSTTTDLRKPSCHPWQSTHNADLLTCRVDPSVLRAEGLEGKVEYVSNLDDLVKQSDVISLHMPLTEKTRGLFGAKYFDMMKPSAVLVKYGCSRSHSSALADRADASIFAARPGVLLWMRPL